MPRAHKVLERQEKGHKRERDQIRSHHRLEEEPMEKRVPTGRGSAEQHLSFGPSSGDVTHLAGRQPGFWLHRKNGIHAFTVWFVEDGDSQAGSSICPVAVPVGTSATPSSAVQAAALQGSTAGSSSSSARRHALEGTEVVFLRQVHADVDDDEEEMGMECEDALAPKRPGADCCGFRGAPDDPSSSSFVVPALRAQQRHRWMAKPRSEEEHRQLSSWARKASLSQTRQRSRIRCPSLVCTATRRASLSRTCAGTRVRRSTLIH